MRRRREWNRTCGGGDGGGAASWADEGGQKDGEARAGGGGACGRSAADGDASSAYTPKKDTKLYEYSSQTVWGPIKSV